MTEHPDDHGTPSYWPSVTDLFMTLFVITVAMLAAVMYVLLPKHRNFSEKVIIEAVGMDLQKIRNPVNRLRPPLGLKPISGNSTPDQVVSALDETCKAAIETISTLRQQVENLQDKLKNQPDIEKQLAELAMLRAKNAELEQAVAALKKTMGSLGVGGIEVVIAENEALKKQLNDKPPIIIIDTTREEYHFKSGKAEIGELFSQGLRDDKVGEFTQLAKEIIERSKPGHVQVDTLEIIGHTDGMPLSGNGNLDAKLPDLLAGNRQAMAVLQAGSNNDLGLLRALAVKHQWEDFVKDQRQFDRDTLTALGIRCYSAGQTVPPYKTPGVTSKEFLRDDPRARRIEMRLTRLRDR